MNVRTLLATSIIALTGASSTSAQKLQYIAPLTGASQSPPNGSPGVGSAVVTFDFSGNTTMRVQAIFANLTGTVTAANINATTPTPRAGTADVATQLPTLTGFPSGATFGQYDHTFDMSLASTYNPAFIAASGGTVSFARGALQSAVANAQAYFNIKTTTFPNGEIRGFFEFNDLRGDFNHNNAVDAADYVVWRNSNGQMGAGLPADANLDGKVDIADYDFWRKNFGHVFIQSIGGASGSQAGLSAASIPEPASVALLTIGLGAMRTLRRRYGTRRSTASSGQPAPPVPATVRRP